MRKILFMHGGSGNHGCEAIIRTTAPLLGGPENVWLWSLTKTEDVRYGAADFYENIVESEQIKRYSCAHLEAWIKRKVLNDSNANMNVFLKNLFKGNMAVSVGGDNYCYPWSAKKAVELDKQIRKYCACSVLWACSVDAEAITPEVREDLAGFDLITARETITYNLLKEINPNTVLVADPAFLLKGTEVALPDHFIEGNTVGINISPLIMQYGADNIIFENYVNLIHYIIERTDMNVCLIPHVVWKYNNDLEPIDFLYQKFEKTGRICKIEDGNATELKGFIARCRYFVGARTHATIAAYSSYVPTLVVGYSVKSKGIALDLFGTDEGYVIPVDNMCANGKLTDAFAGIMQNERKIRDHLKRMMPEYLKRANCTEILRKIGLCEDQV